MPLNCPTAVVAGHICLDIIPTFKNKGGTLADIFKPGTLVELDSAVLATGGPVSNTGLALHRLGVPTRLMGKVGDDLFGDAVLSLVRRQGATLADGMLVAPGEATSYTVVISPVGIDRLFLHCPGANNTFAAADVPDDRLAGAGLFHIGYPPLMRRMFADDGRELAELLHRARARGLVTSLDMCAVDPSSEAGRIDWRALLARTLPHVDLFLPSLEETLFMVDRARFERLAAAGDVLAQVDGELLGGLSGELLDMGAAVVGLKLGARGLYVRTTADAARLAGLKPLAGDTLPTWLARELATPCFEVGVVGTTGCGDCTIAGFLTALLLGQTLNDAVTAAVAVGACNVEQADATSGVPTWEAVQARLARGWRRRPTSFDWPGWSVGHDGATAHGPHDRSSQ